MRMEISWGVISFYIYIRMLIWMFLREGWRDEGVERIFS